MSSCMHHTVQDYRQVKNNMKPAVQEAAVEGLDELTRMRNAPISYSDGQVPNSQCKAELMDQDYDQ
jgi:hypothetical protein